MQLHRGCVQGLKKLPAVTFPSLPLPSSRGSRWMKWGHSAGEGLGVPLWKPPADDPDDPAALISHHTPPPSLPVFLEGFTEPLKWLKCSQVFEYPSKYLSAIKVLEKHCETGAGVRVLLPFVSNWQMLPLILSHPHGLEPSPFFFAWRTHSSIWDCAQGPNKQQPGSSLQFSASPAPFVRWYQLWYFKERCQKCKNEQLRINLLVGMGICLPLLIAV